VCLSLWSTCFRSQCSAIRHAAKKQRSVPDPKLSAPATLRLFTALHSRIGPTLPCPRTQPPPSGLTPSALPSHFGRTLSSRLNHHGCFSIF
jgi:hypothetical protein